MLRRKERGIVEFDYSGTGACVVFHGTKMRGPNGPMIVVWPWWRRVLFAILPLAIFAGSFRLRGTGHARLPVREP